MKVKVPLLTRNHIENLSKYNKNGFPYYFLHFNMIGLFSFDGPLYCDCNGVYCNTTITNEMLKRYFVVVDKLVLLIRTIHIDETYDKRNLKKLELQDRIMVIEIPNLNSPLAFINKNKYRKLIFDNVSKADLVFLRIPSIISNMVADTCIKLNKKYLAEVGGCAWDSYWNHGALGKIIAPYMYFMQRKTVRYAHFTSYVTQRWLQKRYPSHSVSIAASNVYLKEFNEKNILRRINVYNSAKLPFFRVGTIAAIDVRYKGQSYVIRAMGILKKKGIKVEYDLIGAGREDYLIQIAEENGVSDQVHFLGVKLHDDVWEWLDTINLYIQPSKQEGLPRALIEAMNRGCLAIGSDVAGIPELLEEDMIFHAGNVREIAKMIEKVMNLNDYSRRIKRNFEKSKDFEIEELNNRRNNLFISYKNSVIDEKR